MSRNTRASSSGSWPAEVPPEEMAEVAGLRYVAEDAPGIARRRCGRGFTYRTPDGRTLRDAEERSRIEALAIPPAWTDVWICPDPDGHVLATGRDDRDRKQYRYHPRWDEVRDRVKFARVLAFGRDLPSLRSRIGQRLDCDVSDPACVLAAAARLLDRTGIRVGHAEYAERNGTVGLTTLLGQHLSVSGSRIELEFVGKGGGEISTSFEDARLAALLKKLKGRRNERVFRLPSNEGRRDLDADELNEWLRTELHSSCSAKDFRTWHATVQVIAELASDDRPPAEDRLSRYLAAVDRAAETLSNTRSVLRTSYLPPGLEELYVEGAFPRVVRQAQKTAYADRTPGRTGDERLAIPVLTWLLARYDSGRPPS